jgi:hypothetical protein
MAHARGRKEQWAIDEVFGNGDLLKKLKDCFTKDTFILCRAAVRFAKNNQMDIKPVAVRANVDLLAYNQALLGGIKLRICDIEWPARLDPTFDMYSDENLMDLLLGPDRDARFKADVYRITELRIMTKMLVTHAGDLRHLKIHMSLDVELSDDVERAPQFKYINKFLQALAKCTALETLTSVQGGHVEKNATIKTVQFEFFMISEKMRLEVLDFNGNMTIDVGDTESLIDHIPPPFANS